MANMKKEFEDMKISKQMLQEEMAVLRNHYEKEIASVDEKAASIPSPGQQYIGKNIYIFCKSD